MSAPKAGASRSPVHSMTGYSSVEAEAGKTRLRIEMKALNHRFLDLKVRLPRELSSAEMPLRSAVQSSFSRGAIDVKVERLSDSAEQGPAPRVNLSLAAHYYECITSIQRTLGLTDSVTAKDIATFSDVIEFAGEDLKPEEAWLTLEPSIKKAIANLNEMRAQEGRKTVEFFEEVLSELEGKLALLRKRRAECEADYRRKLSERISAIFEAHPIAETSVKSVLESRISQELAMLIDRTDIEEELTRFKNHLDHCRKVLGEGGPVGRKLDFILQELNREINTLGNKAQDFSISEDVVQVKVRLEQLREQVMNLE